MVAADVEQLRLHNVLRWRAGQQNALAKSWTSLTWNDLEAWIDSRSVSRGREYQRRQHVKNLVISERGHLLASVLGGALYTSSVWLSGDSIQSQCTCPVGIACKHAVAVVAEYLELVANKKAIPASDPADPRWEELSDQERNPSPRDDDESDEDDRQRPAGTPRSGSHHKLDEKIERHIRAKSQGELADLVWSLTQRFPELYEELRERVALAEGDVGRMVTEARRELRRLTAESGWVNSWTGQGSVPDYTNLIHRLERLLLAGHADAVVKLGSEIIERGIEQVGRSNDEGETGMALAECFPIIFKAVVESRLPPVQKLLFVIDAELKDDYDLLADVPDSILDQYGDPTVWSEVADELSRRLTAGPKPKADDGFHRDYQRDRLTRWIGRALVNANRREEARALYEQEARKTNSYERLVGFLIDEKRYEEARRWAREGIERTAEKLPGIAAHLAEALSGIARARRSWDEVAAHAAWKFFDQPSRDTFEKLIDAATKAGHHDKVREVTQRFLETGIPPLQSRESGGKDGDEWPLPIPDHLHPIMAASHRRRSNKPHFEVLIDIAIAAKDPEDVLRWFDRLRTDTRSRDLSSPWSPLGLYSDRVAEAVIGSHPQRSIEIYRQRVLDNLSAAKKSAYETVIAYLRKMRPILKSLDREDEWNHLIAEIRSRYHNRPSFMEMLERLDGGTILKTRQARR